jgi:hypothetical protein
MTIVKSKEELADAQRLGEVEILVEGELAHQLRTASGIGLMHSASVPVLAGAIAAAPFTLGTSLLAAVGITGLELAAIIVAVSVGLSLIMAVWNEFEEIEFDPGPPPRLKLRKKGH